MAVAPDRGRPKAPHPRPGGHRAPAAGRGTTQTTGATHVSTTPVPTNAASLQLFMQSVEGFGIPGVSLQPLAQAFINWRKQEGNRTATVSDFLYVARTSTGTAANTAYTALFPNIDKMRAAGSMVDASGNKIPVTEANYMTMYQAYRQATKSLPGYDATTEQMSQFMLNDISAAEVSRRVAAAKEFASTAPEAKALKTLYGVDSDTVAMYLLDPLKGKDEIDKAIGAVRVGAAADAQAGISLNTSQAEMYGMDAGVAGMSPKELRDLMERVAQMDSADQTLSGIDNQTYTSTDALDSILLQDRAKTFASQQRARREAARFGGSSGVSTDTFGGSSL